MNQAVNGPVPEIVTEEFDRLARLEAELFAIDAQVRRFRRQRDRIAAAGDDPNRLYRRLQERRDKTLRCLKRFPTRAQPPDPATPANRGNAAALLSLPLAATRFISEVGIFGFGTSGFVQMAPATPGVDAPATGKYPTSGDFTQLNVGFPGQVYFEGVLNVGPDELPAGQQYDPAINYFWVRNWKYLLAFPPPSMTSRFTYSFDVNALASIFFEGLDATAMMFVSVGETANLMSGDDIVVNTPVGWPLQADLTVPGPSYNGSYGDIAGSPVTVQRSFMVAGGHFPGVAVVVGVIGGLAMGTCVRFAFDQYSGIFAYTGNDAGGVAYHYEPQLVAQP